MKFTQNILPWILVGLLAGYIVFKAFQKQHLPGQEVTEYRLGELEAENRKLETKLSVAYDSITMLQNSRPDTRLSDSLAQIQISLSKKILHAQTAKNNADIDTLDSTGLRRAYAELP